MKYKIIACFDMRIEAFMPPQAVSDMLDEDIVESNRRAILSGKIPADVAKNLVLFKLGTFDDKTGKMEPCNVKLAVLASFLPRAELKVEAKENGEQAGSN